MFDQTAIQSLVDRLGWSVNESSVYAAKLDAANKLTNSQLLLNDYNGLITVENVYYTHPERDIQDAELNAYLLELRTSVVIEILTDVFVLDPRTEVKDYSATILEKVGSGLFDKAIGYCHAVKCVQKMATTVRSNRIEVIGAMKYGNLVSELKGSFTDDGILVAEGLIAKCKKSRQQIKDSFFGDTSNIIIQDITGLW